MGDLNSNSFQEYSTLPVTNNFMFCKVMSDADVCKEFLEIMLKIKIDRIEYINNEQELSVVAGGKAVRLDVYVEDGERTFDIEMQMVETKDLAKRARYYQSLIDLNQINKGMLYMQLKESYVIFLMPGDSFEDELSCYTFESICRENPKIKLDDKATKIFYNFNEFEKEKDLSVRKILSYFATGKNTGGITDKMQELLTKARNNSEWRSDYIRYEHDRRLWEYEAREKGLLEGRQEGLLEGLQRGAHDKAVETARKMLSEGLPQELISRCSGLPLEEVQALSVMSTEEQ